MQPPSLGVFLGEFDRAGLEVVDVRLVCDFVIFQLPKNFVDLFLFTLDVFSAVISYDITFGRVNSEAEISVIEVGSQSNASIQGGDLRNSLADLICLEVGRMSTRRSLVRLLVSHRI